MTDLQTFMVCITVIGVVTIVCLTFFWAADE